MPSDSTRYIPSSPGSIRQGEIFSNLPQSKLDLQSLDEDEYIVNLETHPFAIIISQDCDLIWDFNARQESPPPMAGRLLPNVLVCMAIEEASLRASHELKSNQWRRIRSNNDERYQVLEEVEQGEDATGVGFQALCTDFKLYFTVPTEELYARIETGEVIRRCRLASPYLEHFIGRFSNFQSRIALPPEED